MTGTVSTAYSPPVKYITKTVWTLSIISFLTDTASEMLYPVMPIYLKSIGFSIFLIGVIEGIAEATAGLSKGYFGKLSDIQGRRAIFVQAGYSLSALTKPLMVLFVYPAWVVFIRTLDRFGKGIRTGARDALLSNETTIETKGRVFGFHRSMDTFGAVLGPTVALVYLHYYPEQYKVLFILALAPGLLAIAASRFIHDKSKPVMKPETKVSFFTSFKYLNVSSKEYKKLVGGLLFFALFNSSDVFLLLMVKQAGHDDMFVIAIYIFYNLVYALFSYPLGIVADKMGLKTILVAGLVLFSFVYLGMSFIQSVYGFFFLFALYGIYSAATEGISKAWISNISHKKDTATAIGTYSGLQSICSLIASSLAGFLWFAFGPTVLFLTTAIITSLVALYFILVSLTPSKSIT